jgi:DNA-binding transcriptional ArsR family regulator
MVTRLAHQDVFKAIADETRREILTMLLARPLAVHAIADRFAMSRPAVSKHLRVLGDAGLVHLRREGRENVYALDAAAFDQVAEWLNQFWRGRLSLLKRLAEGDS